MSQEDDVFLSQAVGLRQALDLDRQASRLPEADELDLRRQACVPPTRMIHLPAVTETGIKRADGRRASEIAIERRLAPKLAPKVRTPSGSARRNSKMA